MREALSFHECSVTLVDLTPSMARAGGVKAITISEEALEPMTVLIFKASIYPLLE